MYLFTDIFPRESMSNNFSCWRGTSQCPVFRLWVQEKENKNVDSKKLECRNKEIENCKPGRMRTD